MWVTKLLISPVKFRIFCPKTTKYGPKLAFLVNLGQAMQVFSMPCWWVSWRLWRAGCISQDNYLLYYYGCYYVSLSLSSSSVPTHKTRPWQLRKTRRPRLQLSVALNGVNVEFMLVELNVMEEHCSKDWSDKVVLTKGSDSIVAPLLKLQPDFGGRGESL